MYRGARDNTKTLQEEKAQRGKRNTKKRRSRRHRREKRCYVPIRRVTREIETPRTLTNPGP